MSDKTSIYNMALLLVGASTITSANDDAKGVRVLDAFYDTVRDRLLAAFPWNFAVAQAGLSQLEEPPSFGYACAYQVPADCLSVIRLSQDGHDFRVTAGLVLECDYDSTAGGADPLCVEYVQRVTDEGLFPPHFTTALALALATEAAVPMTGKASLRDELRQRTLLALAEAQAADCKNDRESSSAWDSEEDSWITGRA